MQQRLGLPAIRVAAVCGHDTQCAAFAAPAKTERHIFLSCGTWSLFGTELEQPVLTEQAAALALSNEVGYGRKVTLLKNIIGLWLLQESRREYARQGENYSFAEIETMARQCHEPSCYIDPDDPVFTPPGNIPQRVQAYCRKPDSISLKRRVPFSAAFMRAQKYSRALEDLEACTGAHYPVIHMLGGGVKDGFLQLTADFCQRQVTAGPVEATVYGNAAIQLLNLNAIETPDAARRCIAASETMRNYHPGTLPASIYSKKLQRNEGISCILESVSVLSLTDGSLCAKIWKNRP
ncbi:MAG: FGGY-family carbohydrate kinase [Ruminococcus sp.]